MKFWDTPHASGAMIRSVLFESRILTNVPANFPSVRPHSIFLPPEASSQKLPVLYCLAPWTNAGRNALAWEPFKEDLPSRLMRLISDKLMPPCIVVCPDLFIDYGGSQFVDSAWVGDHGRHLIEELVPWVEQNLPVLPGTRYRGAFGRSSGGFGALRLAMDNPGSFSAVACHSGDMGFDWVYRRSLIDLCTALVKYSNPLQYLEFIQSQKKISGWDIHIMMLLGMCAFYSPNVQIPWGFDLPIDIRTGQVDEAVWGRWVDHDPVAMIRRQNTIDALSKLKFLYIDCGNRDQYFLQYGSRQFTKGLSRAGVEHLYTEFDDNHSGTSYRFDESLPKMLTSMT